MTTPLRFGALLIPATDWATLLERCRRLEELGIECAWIDDHIVNPPRPGGPWAEAWTTLAALAASTTRIRLGTLVANVVLRSPALLAREALTVEQVSGGRLELGVGAGYAETDHRLSGVPQWPRAERNARFREAAAFLSRALTGEPFEATGPHYPLGEVQFQPAPVQPRIPLTIAAHAPSSLRVAAEFGDAWSSFGGYGMTSEELLAKTKQRNQLLDELCHKAGRDPRELRRSLLQGNPAVSPDPIWSSVAAFEDFIGRYREAGITEFVFYYPPESMYGRRNIEANIFERVATDVLPRLRAGA
ncbi:MAG: LLM class flavin-dependent oxidoreductase [Dehalococcoidia bacterium]|nr:LLM class flavin-dependent oxidoreductase [Dehalococcoidia bacterium]